MTNNSDLEPTNNPTNNAASNTAASPSTEPASTKPRRWFRQPAVIGVGAALGTLLLIGGTVAITLEVVEEYNWYNSDRALINEDGGAPVAVTPGDALPPASGSVAVTADAASLTSAIDRAIAAVDGVGASSVALSGGLFEVDVLLADGREIDVYVAADGSVRADPVANIIISQDPAIDTSRLSAVIDAALAAVSASVGQGGVISELSTTSSPGRAFDITVMLPGGNMVYLELADNLSVVEFDLD
jgi:hypothetical protein